VTDFYIANASWGNDSVALVAWRADLVQLARRLALWRMLERAAEIADEAAVALDHGALAWPDILTWSDEAVASAEREIAAMLHRDAERKLSEGAA
jgi:hypothetical protein